MRNRWKRTAAALALAASMAFALPIATASATDDHLEPARACSLNMSAGAFEDLANADVVMDLYKVADLVDDSFAPLPDYQSLGLEQAGKADTDPRALASRAATRALDENLTPAKAGVAAGTRAEGLERGLYLIIAHGKALQDYVIRDEAGNVTATMANSPANTYTFAPELVSLPNNQAGSWVYDLNGSLKPEQQQRSGTLVISKTLDSYNASLGTAVFVYDVEAVLDQDGDGKAETVYSDALSLAFQSTGSKELTVSLPVGAQVTVSEVYTGASYSLTAGEKTQSAVISGDSPAQVSFTNSYNGKLVGGSGVTNHFVYSQAEGHWNWSPQADSTGT